MKKIVFWFLLACSIYLSIEAVCAFTLFIQKRLLHQEYRPLRPVLSEEHRYALDLLIHNKTNYLTFSPDLGWTIKLHGTAPPLYQANTQGIRASRDYSSQVPHGWMRITAFGDSFTHCDDVSNRDTWQEQLARRETRLEVINFGVPAFGLDQAFLRYQQEGLEYHPDLVLIGFMSENIFRHMNVFRPFYDPSTLTPLAKPRFLIRKEQLVLLNNPMQHVSDYEKLLRHPQEMLPQLGKYDHFYQGGYHQGVFDILPSIRLLKLGRSEFIKRYGDSAILRGRGESRYYNEHSEAFQITTKIFDEFHRKAVEHNSVPVILLFPNKDDLKRFRKYGTSIYSPLSEYLTAQNYQYLDLLDAFETYGTKMNIDDIFGPKGHYSLLGNQIIATYLQRYLHEQNML